MSDADLEPFFAAAREGRGDAVLQAVGRQPLLLEARDPHNGGTALHSLARLSAAPAVAKLIAAGADVEARDRNFCSPLHLAARADASVAGADAAGRDGAIIETLRALLKGGARVGARDSFGLTALHHAAQAGHPPACDFLLSLNTTLRQPRAPIEADTNAEERPLHLAAAGGHADVVRCLLEHGAHPGKTNYLGETPLHLAARGGDAPRHLAALRTLCEAAWKADLNVPTARAGETPLHTASGLGHTRAVLALLGAPNTQRQGESREVDASRRNRLGQTPKDVAAAQGFGDVVEALDAAAASAKARAARSLRQQEEGLQRAMREMRVAASGALPARAAPLSPRGGLRDGMGSLAEESGEEEVEEEE